jgi:hypothetical protein
VAAWANGKYHRHHTLLPEVLGKLKDEFNKKHRNIHVPKIIVVINGSQKIINFFSRPHILPLLALT